MDRFIFKEKVTSVVCPCLDEATLCRLWNGFSFTCGELCVDKSGEQKKIVIGAEHCISLGDGDEYTVSVKPDGAVIVGRDKNSLMRGFMALIARIEAEDLTKKKEFFIRCGEIHGAFDIGLRMAHLCVFPETDLMSLTKRIRLLAALQFTHVIIEFWGTLQFDCLPELAWQDKSYKKCEIAPLITEAKNMGMEVIPMFNHLGHATGSRIACGKHVVLDQNPALQHLFTPDGWAWNFESPIVRKLLSDIRHELYGLFGDGEYIHLGFDESFIHSAGLLPKEKIGDFMAEMIKEAEAEGRRAIIWGDMLLCAEEVGCAGGKYYYECTEKNPEDAKMLRSKLPKSILIADWHYDVLESPILTSVFLKSEGFDVIGCPWFDKKNIKAHLETVKSEKLFGAMLTTWHTLPRDTHSMEEFARICKAPEPYWSALSHNRAAAATYLRKLMPTPTRYEDCGFIREQEITETVR